MKYIKTFENKANPKFEKGDVVYLNNRNIGGPLEYGKPYIIKSIDFDFPYNIYYTLEDTDLDYLFPEHILISEDEYLEKIAGEYNL